MSYRNKLLGPYRFHLVRFEDETGVSGTGHVADGVEFSDGKVAIRWRTSVTSTAAYDSIDAVEVIHGHNGKTRVEWLDDKPSESFKRGALNASIDRCENCWPGSLIDPRTNNFPEYIQAMSHKDRKDYVIGYMTNSKSMDFTQAQIRKAESDAKALLQPQAPNTENERQP